MTRTLVIEGSGELWGSERALLDLLDVLPRTDLAICCPAQMPLNDELTEDASWFCHIMFMVFTSSHDGIAYKQLSEY